jgi:hypothetical protein
MKPVLAESSLTGKVYVVTDYLVATDGTMTARVKHDVTKQFERLEAKRAERRAAAAAKEED